MGYKPILAKWIFKIKSSLEGSSLCYKAHLVAYRDMQQAGINYQDIVVLVCKLDTMQNIILLAIQCGWSIQHMDVNSVFLNGILEEEVYLRQPQGFVEKCYEQQVYHLPKTLYAHRQSPCASNSDLDHALKSLGFIFGHADPSLYVFEKCSLILVLLVYVDGLMISGSNLAKIEAIKQRLYTRYDMILLNNLSLYLEV